MSEKSYPINGVSARQASAFALSIPPRFFKAFGLLTQDHVNELMRNAELLDLWMFRVLQMRQVRLGRDKVGEKLTVHWPIWLGQKYLSWLQTALEPFKGRFESSTSPTQFVKYHDVKITTLDDRIDDPTSFCFGVILSSLREPLQFVVEGGLSHWRVNVTHPDSSRAFQALFSEFLAVRNA